MSIDINRTEINTVADLIKVLSNYPQDIPVYVNGLIIWRIDHHYDSDIVEDCIDILT